MFPLLSTGPKRARMHRNGRKNRQTSISESLCIGCGICINKCPHDALIIEQLPSELETDMIHRYSLNGFRLFRLPTPTKESVVGILGPNGMGKSTAFNALSGRITPNLGDWLDQTRTGTTSSMRFLKVSCEISLLPSEMVVSKLH